MEPPENPARFNYALADESARISNRGIDLSVEQADHNTAMDQMQNSLKASAARATARTAAAESGVSGPSVQALMDDFHRQEANYRFASDENLRYTHLQSTLDKSAVAAQRQGRRAAQQPFIPERVPEPNYLGAALSIGGAGLKAYDRVYGKPVATTTTTAPGKASGNPGDFYWG